MTVDLDALEALAKAAALDEWWSAEELGEALTEFNGRVEEVDAAEFIAAADPSTVLALIAELRRERERADEASHAAGRHKSDAALHEAALSRAEETIESTLAWLRVDRFTIEGRARQAEDDLATYLTEYDKQKGADRD